MQDIRKIILLLVLRAAPQDLHYSKNLLGYLLVFYIGSGVLILQSTISPERAFVDVLSGVVVQGAFTAIILNALGRAPRFVQTFSAIIGVSILLNLIAWPIFFVLSNESEGNNATMLMSLLFLLLMSWEVLVKAHIFMHALEVRLLSALALSFSLLFFTIAVSQLLY